MSSEDTMQFAALLQLHREKKNKQSCANEDNLSVEERRVRN